MSKRMFPGLFGSDPTPPKKKASQSSDSWPTNPIFSFGTTKTDSQTSDALQMIPFSFGATKTASEAPDASQSTPPSPFSFGVDNPFSPSFDAKKTDSKTHDASQSSLFGSFNIGSYNSGSDAKKSASKTADAPFIFRAQKTDLETVSQTTIKKKGSYAFIIDFPNTANCKEIEVSIHGETNDRFLEILQKGDVDGSQLTLARFRLPPDANTDHDMSAVTQDGLLTLTVKRLEPKVTKIIKIKSCSCF